MIKIGLIREGKRPIDRRAPLAPEQAAAFAQKYPQQASIAAEKSLIRCFSDEEYLQENVPVQESIHDCDILFGVKEVPVSELIPDKTYFFFSHTVKKQPYNRKLLQEVLRRNIRLIDYERITDKEGNRLVAFGKWAGIVGAYNALWTWGRRFRLFDLRRAHECFDYEELKQEYSKVKLPSIKIALTGGGRVAKGAIEVLEGVGIRRVSPQEFLEQEFQQPVYTQLNSRHYHFRRQEGGFDAAEFYQRPELYDANFAPFYRQADLLIGAGFWNPAAPVLFSADDTQKADFRIKVVADITCDIHGSIPTTIKASTIAEPIYDYEPSTSQATIPLSDEKNITVMAIDNLPCELPRDASRSFGRDLLEHVLPCLIEGDKDEILARATIAEGGQLTAAYQYLKGYVEEQPT